MLRVQFGTLLHMPCHTVPFDTTISTRVFVRLWYSLYTSLIGPVSAFCCKRHHELHKSKSHWRTQAWLHKPLVACCSCPCVRWWTLLHNLWKRKLTGENFGGLLWPQITGFVGSSFAMSQDASLFGRGSASCLSLYQLRCHVALVATAS